VGAPRCLVLGAGRTAGGFLTPLLRAAGWEVVLVSRNRAIIEAINAGGGLWLRTGGDPSGDRWVDGVAAVSLEDPTLPRVAAGADLFATSVGPSALRVAGKLLAPLLRARLEASGVPVNILAFENHRRAPETLITGLIEAHPPFAGLIGRRFGIGGAALWHTTSRRVVTNAGVRFDADDTKECYVGVSSLVPGVAPLDGTVPSIGLVRSFDDRMVEKLWVFNAGHVAAAYLGWQAGRKTLDAVMGDARIRAIVTSVVNEARQALQAYLAVRPGSSPLPPRPVGWILDRYANPTLGDSVVRVAREPRRKLAADDRLIGPALACLAAGIRPVALSVASAAALAYGERSDPQAGDLRRELELLGPEEVLAVVSGLDPRDELARLIGCQYRGRTLAELTN